VPTEHAGGKWRLSYTTSLGRPGNIEVDVNFMLRTPLWAISPRDSHEIGGEKASRVSIVDDHELAAGKLAALVARSASRDVFDAREILRQPGIDHAKLRLGFVIYGGLNRVDWRAITVENIRTTAAEVDSHLLPSLRFDLRPPKAAIEAWTEDLVRETRELMTAVLPLHPHELEFLERLNDAGNIVAELLTPDLAMQRILLKHPGLKCVKQRLGAGAAHARGSSDAKGPRARSRSRRR
jgi:hypothetical protein